MKVVSVQGGSNIISTYEALNLGVTKFGFLVSKDITSGSRHQIFRSKSVFTYNEILWKRCPLKGIHVRRQKILFIEVLSSSKYQATWHEANVRIRHDPFIKEISER